MTENSSELQQLQKKVSDLERTGNAAKAITAIVGLLSAAAGLLVGGVGVWIKINSELEDWKDLKAMHTRVVSGRTVLDHSALKPEELQAISRQLSIPDFSIYALKSEVPAAPDLSGYVRYGDVFSIRSPEGYLLSNNGQNRDEVDLLISGSAQKYWKLEK